MTKRAWFLPLTIIVVLVLVGIAAALTHPIATIRAEGAVRDTVTAFAATEKHVSHLEEHAIVVEAINRHYAPFVSANLLEEWNVSPALAPGVRTHNSAPDHIVIETVAAQGAGYILSGRIVETTSDSKRTAVHEIPVVIFLLRENGVWKVAAYQEQTMTHTI